MERAAGKDKDRTMSDDRRTEAALTTDDDTPPPAELLAVNERLVLIALQEQGRTAEALRLAATLEYATLHDALTGLPNRALFTDRLAQALLAAQRERTMFAVLFIDLDHFKSINDRFGHQAGDLLLQQLAARLRGELRKSDTVARLHGDEFAVLLPGDDAAAAAGVARKLLRALEPPYLLHGRPERVGATIGIAVHPAHGSDADALLWQADAAMYSAKRARGGHAFASADEGSSLAHRAGDGARDPVVALVAPLAAPDESAPAREELQAVNERLLLAGLRERELADQLRRKLAFTSAIADNLGEGVCALDRACRFTFVNPAAGLLLGWAGAELLGRDWEEAVYGRHDADRPLLAAVHAGAAYRDDDDAFVRRDGGTFAAAYSAAPIVADEKVVFRDVTARRLADAEGAVLLARVEAALAFRTRFLAITTHELKAPLTSMKGYAQLLMRRAQRAGDDKLLRSLGTIDQQVDRMTRLTNDLADVARIESDGLAVDPRPLDLRALLDETVAELAIAMPDFTLRLDAPDGEMWVRGDRTRLQQVLINLLTNAAKYADRRREADIALHRDGDRTTVVVTDYGIGIPATQQTAVFEPYVRGTNATAGDYDGLGLGLFISKTIIERHAGTLELDSEEGRGSSFSLSLPLLPPAEDGVGL